MTAAIRACRRNRPRDIEELVEVKGLYVDARDETSGGQTLLMIAACNGNKSTCKKLLLLGAAPNARDGHGRTAVDVAYQYNHFELAEYLRVHGCAAATYGAWFRRFGVTLEVSIRGLGEASNGEISK